MFCEIIDRKRNDSILANRPPFNLEDVQLFIHWLLTHKGAMLEEGVCVRVEGEWCRDFVLIGAKVCSLNPRLSSIRPVYLVVGLGSLRL